MKKTLGVTLAILFLVFAAYQAVHAAERTKSPVGANAYIISPAHGEAVENPVTVKFGLKGMGVGPAGKAGEMRGHHHLLIDVEKLPPLDSPIPGDANHVHFGGGQTETTLTLTPGRHTLQLFIADDRHIAHDPPVVSEKITITVK